MPQRARSCFWALQSIRQAAQVCVGDTRGTVCRKPHSLLFRQAILESDLREIARAAG